MSTSTRLSAFLILAAVALSTASAQIGIGFPGGGIGYPGGGRNGGGYPNGSGYPNGGGGYPGSGNGRNQQMPPDTLRGTLEQISNNQLSMRTDDRLETTILLSRSTRYILISGANGRNTDFTAGDRIMVDASLDNSNTYHAIRVTQMRPDTTGQDNPDDRDRDSDRNRSNTSRNTSNSDDDSDRPRLKRAGSSDAAAPSPSASSDDDPDRPRLKRADSTAAPTASSNADRAVSPQITRGDAPGSASSATVAVRPSQPRAVDDSPIPSAPDDSGPPRLRRGRPTDSEPQQIASASAPARPSIHADDVNGVTRLPEPPRADDTRGRDRSDDRDGDPVIEQAREAVFSFSETLPNYVVKQYTTRYESQFVNGKTSWRTLDNVTADVITEEGVERYKNILVNGKTPREAPEKSGSWSSGEFSSLMQDVFSTATNAEFHGKRSTTIVNRAAYRYDFSVEQPNSHWHIEANSQTYLPGYTGTVWIDKENYRVLRIEMAASSMPRTFPFDQVESAVDYDYILIGDGKHLLPTHSEALSCERGNRGCSRNVIEFRNYRKFTAETSITFDQE